MNRITKQLSYEWTFHSIFCVTSSSSKRSRTLFLLLFSQGSTLFTFCAFLCNKKKQKNEKDLASAGLIGLSE